MATRAISHPSHQVNTSPKTSSSPPHFCKECDVMFESSTSLEVHLAYHKDRLLSRWANPDSSNNSGIMESDKNNQGSTQTSPRDGHGGVNNSSSNNSGPQPPYYHPDNNGLGLYLPPQYNNNTGDRSNDIQVTSSGGGINYRSIPPYPEHPSYGNGTPTTMSNSGNQYSGNPPQQLFSPNHPAVGSARPGENPSSGKQERGSETPAEILDLDSHKVHVYQHQQQQGVDPLSRNNFYRPYLPHLLPPPPPSANNGWPSSSPQPHDQFSPPFPSEHHPIPHPYGIPPQPGGNIVYELIREEHRGGVYTSSDALPPMGYSPQLGPLTPSFRGSFPPTSNLVQQANSSTEVANGLPPNMTRNPTTANTPPPKKSPTGTGTGKKNNSAANANGAAPKTKGWKGGECKRPKTYNCVACNKWFTSSGHLKRHYGTTLHKNSVRQKGESPEEHQQPARKTPGKKSPGDKLRKGGDAISMDTNSHPDVGGGGSSSPSSRTFIKQDDSTSSGKSSPGYTGNNNGPNGRGGEFNSVSPNPPYGVNPYIPYNSGPPPPMHPGYVLQNQFPSSGHGPPIPFSNGFTPEIGTPIGVYSVPTSMVPTTMYNGGFSVLSPNCETALPPFSSVGFSHYDPNSFAHLTTLQGSPFPPHSSPSPASQHRMTPNGSGPPLGFHGGGGPISPRGNESTFGPDSRNSTNPLNRDSPEAVRSASTASGSLEGSLDAVSIPESPMQSMSDFSSGSGAESVKGDGGDSDPGEVGVLKCPECSKTFGRSCYLTQHTNSSHSGGKPFRCSTCGKRFPEEPALSDHFAKHGSDKPYKCTLCPKNFNHKTDLRRHLCLHTGEKPFVCNVCGKGFIRKDHMSKHCETHRKGKHAKHNVVN